MNKSMPRYLLFDRSRLQLRRLSERGHDMLIENLLPLASPRSSFEHPEFDELTRAVVSARQADRPVVVMMGGHPIKLGLSRFLIDLLDRKLITHIATNGAGIIHDFELALAGGTSENVAKWIQTGQFGLWQETSRLNEIIVEAASRDEGLGEAVGRVIGEEQFPNHDISITAAGYRLGIPVTSHVSIGSNILHAMRNCEGAALGKASYTDFLIFARAIQDLEGGVFLNITSKGTTSKRFRPCGTNSQKYRRLAPSRSQTHDATSIFSQPRSAGTTMNDESAIYEDHILRHYEEPYHNATVADATHRQRLDNPVCGDSVTLELQVSDTGLIDQAWFTGTGCIISQASASMLVEHIEGQTLEALSNFTAQNMLDLFRARLTPRRQQCCLLSWQALRRIV